LEGDGGMSVEYSAIAAKLKAMYSRFLTREDYEELLTRKSVNDICAYLKSTEGYRDVLADVNERNIHRGTMEIMLEQEIMDEYVRLYNFMDHANREVLAFWFRERETEFLKREIRYIYTHEERSSDEINQGRFDAFFETHTKINREVMRNAKSLADCIEACKDTPYAEPLQRAENIDADFFSMGMMLDSYFYSSMWHSINRNRDREQCDLSKRLIGTKIDMLNLMWIYRGKKYFDFKNEIIFTYLLPIRYRLSEDVLKQLVNTDGAERFVEAVETLTPYGRLFEDCDKEKFPEENYRYIYNKLSKSIFVNHSQSMVAVYAYLNLKEVELNNITTITEGIRYNLNSEYIREHIGMD
jgi:V/A-type H+-transporting ATPase subunit C